ncbi:hypothetical protein [Acinetobacter bouvetii]|uniref:Uncharacterized protein n=1 Tax=Acinetobacter bouvetii TaxID=202951 RepID=A0A811G759_9GAMM|nr:hypothetical protein [Acinetobacter bouvetii]CAB1210055.1 hypothetical protein SFB21_0730 [Acinetobacter bouvetii]
MSKTHLDKIADISNQILNGILKLLGYTLVLVLVVLLILYISLMIWIGQIRDEQNAKRLMMSQTYDHQVFPSLTEHIFFYKRMHVGDSGSWVMVYPLDESTKKEFLERVRLSGKQVNKGGIECIKPTIKKRWKSLHSNIHYVQPDEWSKDHNDHEVHDSFIVYGSEKPIKRVEQACMERSFISLNDVKQRLHPYWAISEKEKLLFSVYEID